MKKRLVLKPFVLPMLGCIFALSLVLVMYITTKPNHEEKLTYVSGTILDEYVPVVNTDISSEIIKPYTDEKVNIGKTYYEKEADEEQQKNAIIYHEDTYLQNTGIDFINEQEFDVVSILDGEVIEVEEKELLGNTITIRHDNNMISSYQSLSNVMVTKGEIVTQGEVIGKSGTCELNKDLGNHIHFELTVGGKLVNPNNYLGKKLADIN